MPSVLLIGCSTGGPTALEKIFQELRAPTLIPILIVQHMPPVFTEILARRLGDFSGIPASEAKAGVTVEPNHIYVAPGDYHMVLEGSSSEIKLLVIRQPKGTCQTRSRLPL